jgi:hypothetical protein
MMKRACALVFLFATVACSGSNSPTAPSAYNQTVTGSVDVFGTTRHSLSVSRSGTMTLSLAWQDAVVDLDLYLTGSSCTTLYPKSACNILQSSSAANGSSERISRTVSNGETYNILIDNLSTTRPQSYTISINVQ